MSDNHTTQTKASANSRSWQSLEPRFYDDPGWRARIGLLVLASDMSIEWDMIRFTRLDGVDCFTSRMPMALQVNPDTLAALENEVAMATSNLVSWAQFDAIAFGCTSGAIAVGPARLADMIQSIKPGVAVCNPVDSALSALAKLNRKRIALMTPYNDDVNATLEDYLGGRGLTLTRTAAFKQDGDPQINRIDPQCLYDEALKLADDDSDGLFISCTGLCTSGIVQRIEDQIGKPVVTSNQALAWATLRAAGVRDPVAGFGRLFSMH